MNQTTESTAPVTTFGFLRHGQTEWNTLKKIQGSGDSPLTEKGKQETDQWTKTLQRYRWDRIIASDLGRGGSREDAEQDRGRRPPEARHCH